MKEKEVIKAKLKVSRITFEREEFKIVKFEKLDDGKVITVKGIFPELVYGMTYSALLEPVRDPKWGMQYNLVSLNSSYDLKDKGEAKKFMSYFLTTYQLNTLFTNCEDPIKLLEEENAEELIKIKGISENKAKKMITAYQNNKDNSKLYAKLYDYGISLKSAAHLLEVYKSADLVIEKINNNPYVLIDDVEGYGWKKTDAIALNMGVAPTSKFRLQAFIKYYLKQTAMEEGNTWMDLQELRNAFYEVIPEATDEQIRDAIKVLSNTFNGKPCVQYDSNTNRICLTRYKDLEQEIAHELKRLQSAPNLVYDKSSIEKIRKEIEKVNGWEFTEEQMLSTQLILDSPVSIITGGGGSGKTSSLQLATTILSRGHSYSIAQTALSGRAASRMSEITGLEGKTIHRLLNISPPLYKPTYTKNNPLEQDIVILDETSMVDGEIFVQLLRAVKTGAKLVMLGDIHQLEAIGLCNLLNDMIESGQIPYVKLEKIHRQAAKSGILSTALLVKEGKQIIPSIDFTGEQTLGELQDLDLVVLEGNTYTQEVVIDTYKKLLRQGISKDDIDIIVPMRKRGSISLNTLNGIVQEMTDNDFYNSITVGNAKAEDERDIYVNDKIIVTKNCYHGAKNEQGEDIAIFNGNIGKVLDITDKDIVLDIFGTGKVYLSKSFGEVLDLGYAITCHAKQGSEIPYAIVALDSSCYTLASREWLYTALTRAKKRCILIGQNTTLFKAVRTSSISKKHTWLTEMLKK